MIPELGVDVLEALEEEGHLVVATVLRSGRLAVEDEDGKELAGLVLCGLHQRLVVMEPQPIPEPEHIDLLLARARHGVGVVLGGRNGDFFCGYSELICVTCVFVLQYCHSS